MGYRKEYSKTLTLTKSKIKSIKRAQYEIRMKGFNNMNESKLVKALSAFTGVLSFAFLLPTPATLGAAVISSLVDIGSERDSIISVCRTGEDYLESLEYFMDDHPEYDQVKVQLPFIEFVNDEYRIICDNGKITSVHTGDGWLTL